MSAFRIDILNCNTNLYDTITLSISFFSRIEHNVDLITRTTTTPELAPDLLGHSHGISCDTSPFCRIC